MTLSITEIDVRINADAFASSATNFVDSSKMSWRATNLTDVGLDFFHCFRLKFFYYHADVNFLFYRPFRDISNGIDYIFTSMRGGHFGIFVPTPRNRIVVEPGPLQTLAADFPMHSFFELSRLVVSNLRCSKKPLRGFQQFTL